MADENPGPDDIDDAIREIQRFLEENDPRDLVFMARVGEKTTFITGEQDRHGQFGQIELIEMYLEILAEKQEIDLAEAREETIQLAEEDADEYGGFESN